MDLATIRRYLAALERMRAMPEHAAWAASVERELAHPLNQIEAYVMPIHLSGGELDAEQLWHRLANADKPEA